MRPLTKRFVCLSLSLCASIAATETSGLHLLVFGLEEKRVEPETGRERKRHERREEKKEKGTKKEGKTHHFGPVSPPLSFGIQSLSSLFSLSLPPALSLLLHLVRRASLRLCVAAH